MFEFVFSWFSITTLLSLIPAFLIQGLVIGGLIAYFVLGIPFPLPYKSLYRFVAVVSMLVGIWLMGATWSNREMVVEINKLKAEIEMLEKEASMVTSEVRKDYEQNRKQIEDNGNEIAKQVPKLLNDDGVVQCDLDPNVRLLHDSAIKNAVPNTTRRADGDTEKTGTVTQQELMGTVVNNYTSCNEVRAQLEALQKWVKEMERIYTDGK